MPSLSGRPVSLDDARRRADPARVRRVLAIKVHDQLGDYLLCTPALRALRLRYPRARLVLVTRAMLAPLATRDRDLDAVWVMPRLRGPADAARLIGVLGLVTTFRPDLCFVLNSVSRSRTADALAQLSSARLVVGRSRVGAGPLPAGAPEDPLAAAEAGPGDAVYGLDLDVAKGSDHQVDRYLDLVRWAGAQPDVPGLRLDLDAGDRGRGRALLDQVAPWGRGPRVGLHPGAANPLKCWPIDSFVELGAALAGEGARLVVFDSPRETGRAASLRAGLARRGIPIGLVPLGGIERFAAACAALDLLVCNDSGVMHIASALRIPTVSFHALGRPAEWAPRERGVALWAEGAIETIPVAAALDGARRLLASSATYQPAGAPGPAA